MQELNLDFHWTDGKLIKAPVGYKLVVCAGLPTIFEPFSIFMKLKNKFIRNKGTGGNSGYHKQSVERQKLDSFP